MHRLLDLFSGIGGFSLAARWTGKIQTVAFCEIDQFCQRVLTKHWPDVPIFKDIRLLKGVDVGPVDIITGGFPCQPFSQAGKQRGAEDDRHLWPEMSRIIEELRPTWVLGENVGGLAKLGLDQVLSDMEGIGYSTRTFDIPACAVDARHVRHRLWIVGFNPHSYANSGGCVYGPTTEFTAERREYALGRFERFREIMANTDSGGLEGAEKVRRNSVDAVWSGQTVADTTGVGMEGAISNENIKGDKWNYGQGENPIKRASDYVANSNSERRCMRTSYRKDATDVGESSGREKSWFWNPEPNVGRVAHGIPDRVDRLKSLGNAIVPQVAYQILMRMVE